MKYNSPAKYGEVLSEAVCFAEENETYRLAKRI